MIEVKTVVINTSVEDKKKCLIDQFLFYVMWYCIVYIDDVGI